MTNSHAVAHKNNGEMLSCLLVFAKAISMAVTSQGKIGVSICKPSKSDYRTVQTAKGFCHLKYLIPFRVGLTKAQSFFYKEHLENIESIFFLKTICRHCCTSLKS